MMMLQPPRPPLLMRLLALLLCVLLVANPPVASARRSKKQPAAKKAPAAPAGGGGPPPGLTPQVMAQLRPVMEAAEGFAATGQKQRAIEQYLAALRLFPDFDMAHYNLGVTFEETGQFEESSMHYRHTLRLLPHGDPRRADVLSRLGQLSARLGELLTGPQHADQRLVALQEAETMLSEASELQPRNAQLRFSLGKVCGELGKGKQSIKHLTAALKSAPDHPPMQLQLGLALHRHGGAKRAEDAKRYLDAALTAEHADYHAQVGLQLREDMPERARAHFERALELDPKHSQATSTYYRLGAMLHLLGETEEEEALYERAVEAGVWKDAKQRPGYFAPGAQAQAAWPEADQWPELAAAISLLEAKHPTIKAELLQAMKGESGGGGGGGGGGGSAGEGEGEGLPPLLADEDTLGRLRTGIDNENLTDSGLWRQRIYMRNGLPLFEAGETGAEGFRAAFPETVSTVEELLQVGGGEGLPKGSVEFSILDEGTHIKPHCGPSNHKWRFHLGVIVPDRGTTSIRVGDPSVEAARRPWEEGRVLLFDDSYEHEVFHDGTGQGPRIVLIVDVWHPQIKDEGAREQIRRDFAWHAARDSLMRSGFV